VDAVAARIQFQTTRGLAGIVTIVGDGGATFAVDDELWYQFKHLPRAAADLAGGQSAAVPFWTQAGAYELSIDDDDVVVHGDDGAIARFPRAELVTAALDAAERWIAYARASSDPEQEALAPEVEAAVAEARASMSLRIRDEIA
jgi:hypothetical protein